MGQKRFGVTTRHQLRQPPNKAPQSFALSETFPLTLPVGMLLSPTSPSLCSGILSPQKASLVHMLRQPAEAKFCVRIDLGVHLNIGTNFSSPKSYSPKVKLFETWEYTPFFIHTKAKCSSLSQKQIDQLPFLMNSTFSFVSLPLCFSCWEGKS